MFRMSSDARDIMRQIRHQRGLPEAPGLRIVASDEQRPSQVGSTSAPRDGDCVVSFDGARVFLDAVARARLDDKVLHVRTRSNGGLEFRCRPHHASH